MTLSKKLHNRMVLLKEASDSELGMYPGDRWELAGKQYDQLQSLGLVELYHPHNMAHKDRAVLTDKGHSYLEQNQ